MLKANPNFATAKNEDGETALYVLAHNPSAFVSGSQLGLLRRHLDIPCEFFWLFEILKSCMMIYFLIMQHDIQRSMIDFNTFVYGEIHFIVNDVEYMILCHL